jgi:hypothetical protein
MATLAAGIETVGAAKARPQTRFPEDIGHDKLRR